MRGLSLVAIGGDQKIVLTNGDRLKVKASQASACDVVLSVLEITRALSTVDTNQIANGKVKNEDMVASTDQSVQV